MIHAKASFRSKLRNRDPRNASFSTRRRRARSFHAELETLERIRLLSTFVVTNTADSGTGSLRTAITSSNSATPGQTSTISFNIPGSGVEKISLLTALPDITNPVVIDATTISGYTTTPLIELDGTSTPAGAAGLVIRGSATGSVVKGLDIHSFGGDGIDITVSNVVLSGNFIGTGPTGLTAAPNHGSGVVVRSSNATVGGVNVLNSDGTFKVMAGNLISGNGANGVVLAGPNNLVEGNWIGVDSTGKTALGNAFDGVVVDGVSSNTVGGTTATTRNVISGNRGQGVSIANIAAAPPTNYSTSAGQGQLTLTQAGIDAGFSLSTFATNFSPIPNSGGLGPLGITFPTDGGVLVSDFKGTIYKFPTTQDGQIATAVPTVSFPIYQTGGLAQWNGHNYMAGQQSGQVVELDNSGNKIQNIAPVVSSFGIVADKVPGPMYGHLLVSKGGINVSSAIYDVDPVAKTSTLIIPLSGNADGIVLDRFSNILYVALNGYGMVGYDLGTKQKVFDSPFSSAEGKGVDGATLGQGDLRNELFVNTNQGKVFEIPLDSPTTHNLIASGGTRGDLATVDPYNGTFLLTQADRIVRLTPPLGGSFEGGPTALTQANLAQGNLIGLGADGTTTVANGKNGVMVSAGATGNFIGGSSAGQGNTIAGNTGSGVALFDSGTSANAVQGNLIGTDVTGTIAKGNLGDGVLVGGGGSSNQIASNTIANNGVDGVNVDASSVGNTIQANQIYGNQGMGLNITAGPNGQAYPVLSAVYGSSAATWLSGTAAGPDGSTVTVDFYSNTAKDPSGFGQGQFYLGSTTVTAGSSFQVLLPVGATPGMWVSATSTSASAGTSGFAADVAVLQATESAVLISSAGTSTYGQGVTFTDTVTGTPTPGGTVQFQVDGVNFGSAAAINSATGIATSPSIATLTAGNHTVTAIYSGDSLRGSLTTSFTQHVNKAHLTVKADAKSKVYGASLPPLTSTISGFVNGDNAGVVSGAASLTTLATSASSVGVYVITVGLGTLSAANYDFPNLVNSTLTISKAHLTVTAAAKAKLYGAALPTFTSTISGFVNGDNAGAVSGAASLTTAATSASPVGAYPITVGLGTLSATNYDFPNLVNSTLTIIKAHLTVTADSKWMHYGAAIPTLTSTISGFVNGDNAGVVSGSASLTTAATSASSIGTYPITAGVGTLSATNYDFPNLVSGVLTVIVPAVNDFLGTGVSEQAIFRRVNTGLLDWFINGDPALTGSGHPFGAGSLDVPFSGDLDGDGKTDLALYRPSTAQWFAAESGSNYSGQLLATFGWAGTDIPVPANYAGNGKTSIAVYRPTNGQWFFLGQIQPLTFTTFKTGDIPIPGNYDNTGKDEPAIYRPSTGQWIIDGPNGVHTISFGGPNDIPVPGAYDAFTTGNAAVEPAVWRPSTGQFFILGPSGGRVIQFAPGDIPAPGDYDGVGETEPTVYRPSTSQWLLVGPHDKSPRAVASYGGPSDVPTAAPYVYRALGGIGGSFRTAVAGVSTSTDLGATAQAFATGISSSIKTSSSLKTTIPLASPIGLPSILPAIRVRPAQNVTALSFHKETDGFNA